MDRFLTALAGYLVNYEFLALAFVIQKVIFLEVYSRKQLITFLKLILVVSIVVISFHLISLNIPASTALTICFLVLYCGGYMVIPIAYSAYTGRKRYKWLALFEAIPIIGIIDGFFDFIDFIRGMFSSWYVQKCFDLSVPLLIIAILAVIVYKRPPFFNTLVKDIRNRTLTIGEECVVWIVGIWLFVYDIFIEDYFEADASQLAVGYVGLLNFVAASVIIAYVINSNYRDFYQKRNLKLQKSLISTMADLVENRDENTGGHIHRTSRYVEVIARRLQKEEKYKAILTDKYIEEMVIAAPLHDVGKIHIPDSILNKPGKLDADEFATMKTHSAAGGAIITHIEANTGEIGYLHIAREMAEYHHERMDGKGYPHGLKGEEIPLCARILAVADVFDAVSSKRCYKEAIPLDESFAIIAEETGSHFDADVAKAFLDSRAEIEAIYR